MTMMRRHAPLCFASIVMSTMAFHGFASGTGGSDRTFAGLNQEEESSAASDIKFLQNKANAWRARAHNLRIGQKCIQDWVTANPSKSALNSEDLQQLEFATQLDRAEIETYFRAFKTIAANEETLAKLNAWRQSN